MLKDTIFSTIQIKENPIIGRVISKHYVYSVIVQCFYVLTQKIEYSVLSLPIVNNQNTVTYLREISMYKLKEGYTKI